MALQKQKPLISEHERELKRREATRKRMMGLALTCIVAIVARLVIKNPEPPKPPDHSNKPIRVVPGMLKKIPPSELAKLSPEMLAKLREVDARPAGKPDELAQAKAGATGAYKPTDVPVEDPREKELAQEFRYQYAKRQKVQERQWEEYTEDKTKTILVRLTNGRHIKAQSTRDQNGFIAIQLDRSMTAALPRQKVARISEDALTWTEPIQAGYVRLKPAKGITVTLHRSSAERITRRKEVRDES